MAAASKMILLPKQVEVSKLTYSAPKKLDNGGKIIPIYYDKAPLILQTPAMPVPYGMNDWQGDNGVHKYSVNLSFSGGDEPGTSMHTFRQLMATIDAKLVQDACDNSFAWLGKKSLSSEVATELYTPIVKMAKDKETGEETDRYPPTMKATLPSKDGEITCEAYNTERQQLDVKASLVKRSKATAILQCTGIWVAGGRFGTTWKVLQMKLDVPNGITGYAFAEDADDDDEDEDSQA
jgi:hypothetical protein